MTDRELLELAAKAAGVVCKGWCLPGARSDGWHGMYTGSDDDGTYVRWNPLTDDGDALRLFCVLPWMCIEISDLAVTVRERGNPDEPSRVYLMWTEWLDKHNGELAAATRRAITRAAAEIGKGTKPFPTAEKIREEWT
jgi:hypothetical protein